MKLQDQNVTQKNERVATMANNDVVMGPSQYHWDNTAIMDQL